MLRSVPRSVGPANRSLSGGASCGCQPVSYPWLGTGKRRTGGGIRGLGRGVDGAVRDGVPFVVARRALLSDADLSGAGDVGAEALRHAAD